MTELPVMGAIMDFTAKLRTCLWFDSRGDEAVDFYVSLFPNSRIENVVRADPNGPALVVEFRLAGAPMMVLNGGPRFPLTEAVSLSVLTEDQAETDHLWNVLTAESGAASQCGWLKDRFGLSWQIVPKALPRLLASPDPEVAARVTEAMMKMGRIDIAALEAAAAGSVQD